MLDTAGLIKSFGPNFFYNDVCSSYVITLRVANLSIKDNQM